MTCEQVFNETLSRATDEKMIKSLARKQRNKKVKELVAQGIDKMIAESLVDAYDTCGLSIYSL